MYDPLLLPTTGGGLAILLTKFGLGESAIIIVSLFLIGTIVHSFLELRRGENILKRRGHLCGGRVSPLATFRRNLADTLR